MTEKKNQIRGIRRVFEGGVETQGFVREEMNGKLYHYREQGGKLPGIWEKPTARL